MPGALLGLALLFLALGWIGVLTATTGTSTGTISQGGIAMGLTMMIAGCGVAVIARMAQAGQHDKELLGTLKWQTGEMTRPAATATTPPVAALPLGPVAGEPETKRIQSYKLDSYIKEGWVMVSSEGATVTVRRGGNS